MLGVIIHSESAGVGVGRTLQSLLGQSYPASQALVVETGPQPSLFSSVSRNNKHDRRVPTPDSGTFKTLHRAGTPLGLALKDSLHRLQTPWVMVLHAGEELFPLTLERFAEQLADQPPQAGVYGRAVLRDGHHRLWPAHDSIRPQGKLLPTLFTHPDTLPLNGLMTHRQTWLETLEDIPQALMRRGKLDWADELLFPLVHRTHWSCIQEDAVIALRPSPAEQAALHLSGLRARHQWADRVAGSLDQMEIDLAIHTKQKQLERCWRQLAKNIALPARPQNVVQRTWRSLFSSRAA